MNTVKLGYFVLAAAGLALCLYYGEYFGAGMIVGAGFMVAQA